jgi:hypothetical protein
VGVNRVRRIQPARAASQPSRSHRPRAAIPPTDQAALAFLSEILLGDRSWTVAEVRRVVAMREAAELGRWRVAGSDEDHAAAT